MIIRKIIKLAVIFSIIPSLYNSIYPGRIAIASILCSYAIFVGIIYIINRLYVSRVSIPRKFDGINYIYLFIIYNLIVLLRGLFDAQSIEDWKSMFSNVLPLYLVTHFSLYIALYPAFVIDTIRTFLTYGLLLCLLIYVIEPELSINFIKSLSPIYFIILIIPYLDKKNGILIITVAAIFFFSVFTNRANMLNIIIAFVIVSTFIWRKKKWIFATIQTFRFVLLALPPVFLVLGLSGIFNVFLIGESLSWVVVDEKKESQDLLIDSRTAIYNDVFGELERQDSFLFGLGASGKTKTSLTDISYADFDVIYKEGRRGTESGMLNYIQWGGIIGGLLYFLLFIKASYLGVYKSKNWFCIMIGLWVAFKGMFSFIEDRNFFSISTIFIFLAISLCMSKKIRSLKDNEIKLIFNKHLKII
nr:hypothetical protein [uncultured Flavobacterium sp.]